MATNGHLFRHQWRTQESNPAARGGTVASNNSVAAFATSFSKPIAIRESWPTKADDYERGELLDENSANMTTT